MDARFISALGKNAGHRALQVCLCLLVSVLACSAQAPVPYQTTPWQFVGPAAIYNDLTLSNSWIAGPVLAIAPDTTQSGTAYLGAWDGGVWKTGDNGQSWQPLTDTQLNLAIGALALAASNHDVIYAGTGTTALTGANIAGSGLLVSTDGGQTWILEGQSVFHGLAITRIQVDPQDAQHLFAAAAAPSGSTGLNPGLFVSTDGGANWQRLLTGNCRDFLWLPAQQQIVADQNGALAVSSNNGASFQPPAAPPPSGYLRLALAVSAGSPATIWLLEANAQGNFGGLYQSLNGGSSWVPVNILSNVFTSNLFGNGQGANDIVLAVDPVSGTLYAGGVDLWYSTDQGADWTNLTATQGGTSLALVHAGQHALAFGDAASGGEPMVWLANDGGVWSSSNPVGQGFNDLNASLSIMGIAGLAASGTTMLAATATEGFAESLNNTGQWNTVSSLVSGTPALVAGGGAAAFALAAQAQALEISSAPGMSFVPQFNQTPNPSRDAGFAAQHPPLWVNPANSAALYLATDQLWSSSDGGGTWSPIPGSQASSGITALAAAPPWLAEGSAQGQVLVSENSGLTWQDLSLGLPARGISGLVWTAAGTLAAAFTGTDAVTPAGHVFTYSGGGWTDITGSLPDLPIAALLADPLDARILYAANSLGVWATPDLGQHWLALGQALPRSQIVTLTLRPKSRKLLAGTAGRGIWSFPLQPNAETGAVISGNNQSAAPGAILPLALEAQVLNAFGAPLSGVTVTWSDNGAGGGFSAPQSLSDSQGLVQTTYTLPSVGGTVAVLATPAISSGASQPARFTEIVVAAAAAKLIAYSGSGQSQTVNQPLSSPLVVRVEDSLGNPVAGFSVSFSDANAGGSFSPLTAVSDSSGNASTVYTLPPAAGAITITADGGSLAPVRFSETALAAPDFSLSLSPASQNVSANSTAQMTLSSQSIGGDTKTILLNCVSPTTGCSVSPASIAPGSSSTVTVGTGSLADGGNTVTLSGNDGTHTHTASAVLTLPGISLQTTPSSASINPGQSASFTLALAGEGGFNSQVSLACGAAQDGMLPYGMGCSFKPSSPTVNATGVSVVLSVTTLAAGASPPLLPPVSPFTALEIGLAALLLIACVLNQRLRLIGVLGISLLLCACGGSAAYFPPPPPPPGTPPGTYSIVVTASAAGIASQQATLSVTVN